MAKQGLKDGILFMRFHLIIMNLIMKLLIQERIFKAIKCIRSKCLESVNSIMPWSVIHPKNGESSKMLDCVDCKLQQLRSSVLNALRHETCMARLHNVIEGAPGLRSSAA